MATESTSHLAGAIDAPLEGGMPEVIAWFAEDWQSVRSFFHIACSREDGEEIIAFLTRTLERLGRLDFDSMGQSDRIDWLAFRGYLEATVARERQRQQRELEVADYLPFAAGIVDLAHRRRRGERPKGQQFATILDSVFASIAKAGDEIRSRFPEGGTKKISPKDKVLTLRVCKLMTRLQTDLENWASFYHEYDPEITWWIAKPYEEVKRALENHVKLLRRVVLEEDGEDPVVGDPIGRQALLDDLASEWIAYDPEDLIEIAEKEFEWCQTERRKAAREMGFGDNWRAALAHIHDDYLQPGEQPGLVRELAEEAIAYLKKHDLVTIPALCETTWEMKMMTPERQKVNPYFTGGQTISISFPTNGMTHEEKLMSLRGNNRHFARATVQHELIPGHHLQSYMSERFRPYRKIFRTPFFIEGWALYWEIILYEKDFHDTAPGRTGALFWRAHRAARVIFSLRFHLGQMTAEEAIAFLEREVGHEHRNAVAEVRRSVSDEYPPLYQAAYLLGGLQMRALRAELVDSGMMKEKQFHDAVLRESHLPIELLRTALLGDVFEKEHRCQWRFG
jgi:hypothetical protein